MDGRRCLGDGLEDGVRYRQVSDPLVHRGLTLTPPTLTRWGQSQLTLTPPTLTPPTLTPPTPATPHSCGVPPGRGTPYSSTPYCRCRSRSPSHPDHPLPPRRQIHPRPVQLGA